MSDECTTNQGDPDESRWLTEEYPPDKHMRIVPVLPSLVDVGEGKQIKLGLSTAARRVDWKQHREGNAHASKADHGQHLQEAKPQVAVK